MCACIYDWIETVISSSCSLVYILFHEWNNCSNTLRLLLYDSSVGSIYKMGLSSHRNRIIFVSFTSCIYIYIYIYVCMYVCMYVFTMYVYMYDWIETVPLSSVRMINGIYSLSRMEQLEQCDSSPFV